MKNGNWLKFFVLMLILVVISGISSFAEEWPPTGTFVPLPAGEYPVFYNRLKPRVSEDFYGDLKVTKSVSNISGDDHAFTIDVLLTDDSENSVKLTGAYDVVIYRSSSDTTSTVNTTIEDGVISIVLYDGDNFVIKNLPEGTVFTVTESNAPGYTPSYSSLANYSIERDVEKEIDIENVYSSYGECNIEADKYLVGDDIKYHDGEFNFSIYNRLGQKIGTATNDENGHIVFPTISFTQDDVGQKTFFIMENAGDKITVADRDPVTGDVLSSAEYDADYDDSQYRVVVDVVDNGDGTITATPSYPDGSSFRNTIVGNYMFDKLDSATGVPVVGASMQILKAGTNQVVDEWLTRGQTTVYIYNNVEYVTRFDAVRAVNADGGDVSSIVERVVPQMHEVALDDGNYILREVEAPDGYARNFEDIVFTVDNNGIYVNGNPVAGINPTMGTNEYGYTTEGAWMLAMRSLTMTDEPAYDLTISKFVDGDMASRDKYFKVTVEIGNLNAGASLGVDLSNADRRVGSNSATIDDYEGVSQPNKLIVPNGSTSLRADFYLQNGQSVLIKNIPQGATYKVVEASEDYYSQYSIDSGVIENGAGMTSAQVMGSADHAVVFMNTRDGLVPTGVIMTVAPYAILILLGVTGVVIYLVMKKRKKE